MPRWSDQLKALRETVAKRPPGGAAVSAKGPAKASALMSRTTIWLDGQRARTLGAGHRAQTSISLAAPGDVAAALKAIEALAPKP